jgi:quercetin 2,3-dioxygenase
MELSVVRIHQPRSFGDQPIVQARPVIHPDRYLSQRPFILLNEESYPPLGEFSVHSHPEVIAVTLVVDGSLEQADGAGAHQRLSQGDANFSIGGGPVTQASACGESGVRLLRLWIRVPESLKPTQAHGQVVRFLDARRADLGDASALLYTGTLGTVAGPYASPWPVTLADLSIPAGKRISVPLASTERSFAYVLGGNVELGRNQVQLTRGGVAWIERTVREGLVNSVPLYAAKDIRILLFSSPVFEVEDEADGECTASASNPKGKASVVRDARPRRPGSGQIDLSASHQRS